MSNLSNKLTLDASLHNLEMNKAASSVKELDKQIANAEKSSRLLIAELKRLAAETRNLENATKNAGTQVTNLFGAFRSGNLKDIGTLISSLSSSLKVMAGAGPEALIGTFSGLASSVTACINPMTLCAAGVVAVGAACVKAAENVREFNSHIREMKQKLGDKLSGDQIEEIAEFSKHLASLSTQTATETIDNFRRIGAAMPELTKNQDAFNLVVTNLLDLQDALNMSQDDSIKAMTTAMTLFGVSANGTTQFINSFAAATQNTKMTSEELAGAFSESAQTAQRLGIGYQDTLTAITMIGQEIPNAAAAGGTFNQMLTKLSLQANNEFNPAVVGLQQALQNLSNANLTAADYQKLFGKSGQQAALILLLNVGTYDELKTKLEDTNTATELAAENNDTLSAKTLMLENSFNGVFTELGNNVLFETLGEYIKDVIDFIRQLCEDLRHLITWFNKTCIGIKLVCGIFKILWKTTKEIYDIIRALIYGAVKVLSEAWQELLGWLSQTTVWKTVASWIEKAWGWIKKFIEKVVQAYKAFKKFIGAVTGENVDTSIDLDVNIKQTVTTEGDEPLISTSGGNPPKVAGGGGKTSGGKTTTPKTTTPKPEKTEYLKWQEYIEQAKAELAKLDNLFENGAWGDPKTEKALQTKSEKIQQVFKSLISNLEKIDYKEAFKGNAEAMQQAIQLIESYSIQADIEDDFVKGLKAKEEEAKKEAEEYLKLLLKTAQDVRDSKIALNLAFTSGNTKSTKTLDIVDKYSVDPSKYKKKVEEATSDSGVSPVPKVEITIKPDIKLPDDLKQLVEEEIEDNLPQSCVTEPAVIVGKVKVKGGLTDVYKQVEQILGTDIKEINLPTDLIADLELKLGLHINTEGDLFGDLPDKLKKNTEFLGDVQGVIQERMDAIKKEIEKFKDFQANYEINLSKASTDEEKADIEATQEYLKGLIATYNKLKEAKLGVLTQTATVEDESEKWKKYNDTASNLSSVFNQASSAVSQFGENSKAAVAVLGALLIAGIIASLMASYAQAMASPATSAGGVWTWIAGGIAGAAALASMITQLKSIKGYSTGGIVGGTSTIGDFNMARLNSGEMVINKSQQGHLWNLLNNTESLSVRTQSPTSGSVEFKIRGRNLIGVLSNENSRASRI